MNTPQQVSDYMREMQARSAKSRWAGMTGAEKSAAMKALRAKTKRKPRASVRRSNEQAQRRGHAAADARQSQKP